MRICASSTQCIKQDFVVYVEVLKNQTITFIYYFWLA